MASPTSLKAGPPTGDRDILIVGAGLAGLFLALRLAPRKCTVIAPAPLGEAASSAWAQGGLAAALDPLDTAEAHAKDTVVAGAGLVDPVIARLIAEEGPSRVLDLIELGVPFDRTPEGALSLSLEAAHSVPRVARVAGDLAGKAIMDALVAAVHETPSIRVMEGYMGESLMVEGRYVLRLRYGQMSHRRQEAEATVFIRYDVEEGRHRLRIGRCRGAGRKTEAGAGDKVIHGHAPFEDQAAASPRTRKGRRVPSGSVRVR